MSQPDDAKVFCISMQRCGTTSVGKFFVDFGFRWAGWPADEKNGWSASWYDGDFEAIFSSPDFAWANAFEDSPWWLPDFYKVLFHRFPRSRFVLFTRDADAWFRSMVDHSGGDALGDNRVHAKIYRRELEFFDAVRAGRIDDPAGPGHRMMTIEGHAEQYANALRLHALEVEDFFRRHAPERLHLGRLEDPGKWTKLGAFLGLDVPDDYESHANAS